MSNLVQLPGVHGMSASELAAAARAAAVLTVAVRDGVVYSATIKGKAVKARVLQYDLAPKHDAAIDERGRPYLEYFT
jgi:hypothetical protein